MSFQLTILKVLAGHPERRVSLADLKHYVAVLTSSGADWSQRMKRLAARAPGLDIFSYGYVLRESTGWQITETGRAFLTSIEASTTERPLIAPAALQPTVAAVSDRPQNIIQLAEHQRRRGRAAA